MPVDDKGREIDESWEGVAGYRDDFDGTIVSSRFGTMDQYHDDSGSSQPLFIATIKPRDGDPFDQAFSIGKGWEIAADGLSVSREDGKRKFVNSTMYMMLANRAKSLYPDITTRGPIDRIGPFNGTDWHWKSEKIEYGGRLKEREHLLPSKFIGATADVGPGSGGPGAGETVADDLKLLALEHEDHKSFLQAFLKDKGLQQRTKDAGLTKAVLSNREDGLWHTARKEAGLIE